ncbi:helix-turn-helix domain-containing protein [Paraburkholderia acidisoli]|uniref:Helix-turn-helix domain-containing protein n=1 Tax=Paraburkholderia acidisoli TaxID=2571748 RepID=A0A7Z2GMM2_9BURK|nr:XRE family transcriptional regulator [Paraburkholderia acidisoli]QGZ64602.1 helix-turn-helix domain-containing protein [Paraburkholderia acidisoli]
MQEADINSRIAAKVRDLRGERGYTLDVLATRCGVSRSMISSIERAASSPTAAVLEKIAAGLNVSLATLFDDARAGSPPEPLVRRPQQAEWRDTETGYTRKMLSPPNWASPLKLTEVVLPAGARVAYEGGKREATIHQHIWLMEGQINVVVGDRQHALAKGDCLAMTLGLPLVFSNPSPRSARYLVALAEPLD